MKREASGEVIEQAVQNIMDAVESVHHLPTDDASTFIDAFYGLDGVNLASDMATLVEAYGEPLKAKGKEAILFPDREQIQVQTEVGKKHRFVGIASTWGDIPEDGYQDVSLQVSTRVTPLITRHRDVWGIKMRAHNASSSLDNVTKYLSPRPQTPAYDEAFYVHYHMWKRPVGLRSKPGILSRLNNVTSPEEPELKIKHTPEGIPVLPSSETNRQLQLFVNNFFDLNLLLLSATGIPIAVEFVEEHQTSPFVLGSVKVDPDQ